MREAGGVALRSLRRRGMFAARNHKVSPLDRGAVIPKPPKRGPKPKRHIKRSSAPIARKRAPRKQRAGKLAEAKRELTALMRRECLGRDGNACQGRAGHNCGRGLDCAHILPKSVYPELRYAHENLLTICRNLHTYYTPRPNAWLEFCEWRLGRGCIENLRWLAQERRGKRVDVYALLAELKGAA